MPQCYNCNREIEHGDSAMTNEEPNRHKDGTPIKVGQRWKHADGSVFTIFGQCGITYALHFDNHAHGVLDYDLCDLGYIDFCELIEEAKASEVE